MKHIRYGFENISLTSAYGKTIEECVAIATDRINTELARKRIKLRKERSWLLDAAAHDSAIARIDAINSNIDVLYNFSVKVDACKTLDDLKNLHGRGYTALECEDIEDIK